MSRYKKPSFFPPISFLFLFLFPLTLSLTHSTSHSSHSHIPLNSNHQIYQNSTMTSTFLLSPSSLLLLTLLLFLSSFSIVVVPTTATTVAPSPSACPNGQFRSAPGVCTPCPAGHYNWYPHATSCTPCPPNTYTPHVGVVDRSLCLACPIDSYAPAGSASCMRCPIGQVQQAVANGPADYYGKSSYGYGQYYGRSRQAVVDHVDHDVNNEKMIFNNNIKMTNVQRRQLLNIRKQRQEKQIQATMKSSSSSSSSSSPLKLSSKSSTNGICAPCTHPSCLCSFHSCPSSVVHCKRPGYILPPDGVSYFAPSVCVSAVSGCPGNLVLRQFVRRAICENPKTGSVVCPPEYLFDGVDRCVTCQPGAKLVYVPGKGKYHRKVQCHDCIGNSVSPGGLATKCKKCPCGYAPTASLTKCFNTIPEGVEFSCN